MHSRSILPAAHSRSKGEGSALWPRTDLANETGFDQFVRQQIAMRSRIDDRSQSLRATIA
jgi:hypothetical protein